MNKLFIFLGPSGSGKTTLADKLTTNHSDLFYKVITATTRQPRCGEVDGKDYYFLTKDTFNKSLMAEFEDFDGNIYGTPKKEFYSEKNIILVVEPKGSVSIKKYIQQTYKDKIIKTIYFNIDEETRKNNMVKRGDPLEKVETRMAKDNINQLIKDLNILIDFEFTNLESISEEDILKMV
jgi:guanylate kinase